MLKYFAWNYFRAFVWIALISVALWRSTGNAKIVKAFVAAHLVALGAGALGDYFLINLAPKSWLTIGVMQWVFVAPIAIFTVISLYIANWGKPVKIPDVLVTMVPIAAWGLMVVYGWQMMWFCHVLGGWFVSAASGGVDLYARFGPEKARSRSWTVRFVGYAAVVATVYLLLPRTE